MPSLKKRPIVRGLPPVKVLKRHTYRNAIGCLMRDFDGRCAYSMQHYTAAGPLEVDHFDPRLKNEYIQRYDNLFPASRHVNGKKGNRWPSRTEFDEGCRFLNPCSDIDYGEQIFEDPQSHELIGTTIAARWHIRMCGLNSAHLVEEREKRTQHWERIRSQPIYGIDDPVLVLEMAKAYRELVESMIPEIPAPTR